uniref:Uncharacterized protein n=1 Tax=Aedes albopictus TaxID=7160 RepID=A0A1W7R4K3_AEDAL
MEVIQPPHCTMGPEPYLRRQNCLSFSFKFLDTYCVLESLFSIVDPIPYYCYVRVVRLVKLIKKSAF